MARGRLPKVFMMDLLATVPYYTAYLSRALLAEDVAVQVGSISYYLDPACFSSRGLTLDPGLMDVVGTLSLPRVARRVLKLAETVLNLAALTIRFTASPPALIHVQYLPLLRWRIPLDAWFVGFCKWRGAKVVLTVHDLLPHDTADKHREAYQALYRRVDALICHSDHVKGSLMGGFCVPAEKISVIGHGPFFFDLPEEDSARTLQQMEVQPEQLVVLWQGIVFPYKGLDLLLAAWQSVEQKIDDGVLLIVGTGTREILDPIREQVRELRLKRVNLQLRFVSPQELVDLYRRADVVVYPYRAITTSGALATGLALGKTLLASDLPVFRELLTNGEDALLVQPMNAAELTGAIVELLRNRLLRERFASRIRARNFGPQAWITIARQTKQVYEDVVRR